MKNKEIFKTAAKRTHTRPEYLGWVFCRYQVIERISEKQLRDRLGIDPPGWARLQLCLRPRPDHFLDDVSQIARALQVDRAVLAGIIRRVEAVEAIIAPKNTGSTGTLLAARSRKKKRSDSGGTNR